MADAPAAQAAPPPVVDPATGGGNIFASYDPNGAMGGLFAPAFIRGFQPSEDAVAAWTGANHISRADVDASRMPNQYQNPIPRTMADGVYDVGGIPQYQTLGDPRGSVDPEALRVWAQGGKYDAGARRDAIAARVASNQNREAQVNAMVQANPSLKWWDYDHMALTG